MSAPGSAASYPASACAASGDLGSSSSAAHAATSASPQRRGMRRYGLEENLSQVASTQSLVGAGPACPTIQAADPSVRPPLSVVLYAPPRQYDALNRPIYEGTCPDVEGHVTFDTAGVRAVEISISAWATANDPDAGVGRQSSKRDKSRQLVLTVKETFQPHEFVPWDQADVMRLGTSTAKPRQLADLPFSLPFPKGISSDAYAEGQINFAPLPPSFEVETEREEPPPEEREKSKGKRIASLTKGIKRGFERADQSRGVWYGIVVSLVPTNPPKLTKRSHSCQSTLHIPAIFLGERANAAAVQPALLLPSSLLFDPARPLSPGWTVNSCKTRWASVSSSKHSKAWAVLAPELTLDLHLPRGPLTAGHCIPFVLVLRPEAAGQLPGGPGRRRTVSSPRVSHGAHLNGASRGSSPASRDPKEAVPDTRPFNFLRKFRSTKPKSTTNSTPPAPGPGPESEEGSTSSLEHPMPRQAVTEDLRLHLGITLVQTLQTEETNVQAGARPVRQHILAAAEQMQEVDWHALVQHGPPPSEPSSELEAEPDLVTSDARATSNKDHGWRLITGYLAIPSEVTPSFRCAAVELQHTVKVDLLPAPKVARWAGQVRTSTSPGAQASTSSPVRPSSFAPIPESYPASPSLSTTSAFAQASAVPHAAVRSVASKNRATPSSSNSSQSTSSRYHVQPMLDVPTLVQAFRLHKTPGMFAVDCKLQR